MVSRWDPRVAGDAVWEVQHTLQHTLQRTATHRNALQRTATHFNFMHPLNRVSRCDPGVAGDAVWGSEEKSGFKIWEIDIVTNSYMT